MAKKAEQGEASTAALETQLWAAADKLRGNMEPSDYKQVWRYQDHRAVSCAMRRASRDQC